ncbi:MAG: glycerol-3-phosphate dehydrogenase/oxidase [Hyphomicrobiales bacterium]
MRREKMIQNISPEKTNWDVIIIGGGATGIGTAVESATRGYKTLLLEQSDFTKSTSSKSTKLVHGGVRYLAQGDVSLVLEALRERGLLRRNAPHLVKNQEFIIPNYEWWGGPYYYVGLTLYNMLAGKLSLGKSKHASKRQTVKLLPTVNQKGLHSGVTYYDGQFDDSRLAINLLQTFEDNGGTAINYFPVTGLIKDQNGKVKGVKAKDLESSKEYELKGSVIINATGVFVDDVIRMDDPKAEDMVRVSQGIHLMLGKEFFPGDTAVMIPKTDDGRVLFAVPWHNQVVVGTTDALIEKPSLEPKAVDKEVNFILETAGRYLTRKPKRSDVLSVFVGLRPLAKPKGDSKKTKEISRRHKLVVSDSGLVTITGGKWTTYRQMSEETVDEAAKVGSLPSVRSVTKDLKIHGSSKTHEFSNPLYFYGADLPKVMNLIDEDPSLGEKISKQFDYIKAQIVWAVREEMARNIEDFLARRVRMLLLDARESVKVAPIVAEVMAKELGKDKKWEEEQVRSYAELAKVYLLD